MSTASVTRLFEDGSEPVVELTVGAQSARVALFGATVISWRTGDRERLWMSSLSARDGSYWDQHERERFTPPAAADR